MNGPHWIKQWIADLAMLNDQFRNDDGSVDFDALGREEYMFRMALITRNFSKSERALVVFEKAQASYETNVERGKKGGRPRKEDVEMRAGEIDSSRAISAQAGSHKAGNSPARRFSNKEDFLSWAIDSGLDPVDAGECWDATAERGGKDGDGNRVNNMEAFAKQWCRTRAKNRGIA